MPTTSHAAGTVEATSVAGTFLGTENFVATGGTGRFADATGAWTTVGTLQFGMVDGRPVGIYNGTVSGSLNLSAVPEPATWAMMFCGIGLIGGTLRRHGRSPVAGKLSDRWQPKLAF